SKPAEFKSSHLAILVRNTILPTYEELEVEECNLSSPFLKAGAMFLGKHCETINNEFMLCKSETKDPRQCLSAGKAVTACSMDFFRKVKKNCAEEFTEYAKCLDMSGPQMTYENCRNTQAVFDSCMFEKLGMVRPPYGYFSEVRVHDSSRPAPKPAPPLVFPDALPDIPTPEELPRPKAGSGCGKVPVTFTGLARRLFGNHYKTRSYTILAGLWGWSVTFCMLSTCEDKEFFVSNFLYLIILSLHNCWNAKQQNIICGKSKAEEAVTSSRLQENVLMIPQSVPEV
ncbi:unnamed protein product, partial [Allacma fusca]